MPTLTENVTVKENVVATLLYYRSAETCVVLYVRISQHCSTAWPGCMDEAPVLMNVYLGRLTSERKMVQETSSTFWVP